MKHISSIILGVFWLSLLLVFVPEVQAQEPCGFNITGEVLFIQSTAYSGGLSNETDYHPCCANWSEEDYCISDYTGYGDNSVCDEAMYDLAAGLSFADPSDGLWCGCSLDPEGMFNTILVGQETWLIKSFFYRIWRGAIRWDVSSITEAQWAASDIELRFHVNQAYADHDWALSIVAPVPPHSMYNIWEGHCLDHTVNLAQFCEMANGVYTDEIATVAITSATSGWVTVSIPTSQIEDQVGTYAYLYLLHQDDYNGDLMPTGHQEGEYLIIDDVCIEYPFPITLDFVCDGDGNYTYENITCVQNLIATPLSSTEIAVSWTPSPDANTESVIQRATGTYPADPGGGTRIYQGHGDHVTDNNLEPGHTYYYRGWTYNETSGAYSLCYDEDYATTLAGSPIPVGPTPPPEWFQTPNCKIYEKLPIYTGLTGLASSYSVPLNNFCLYITLCGIFALSLGTYWLTKMSVVTLGVFCVAIVVAAIAGVLPLWMLLPGFIMGGIALFVWFRT